VSVEAMVAPVAYPRGLDGAPVLTIMLRNEGKIPVKLQDGENETDFFACKLEKL